MMSLKPVSDYRLFTMETDKCECSEGSKSLILVAESQTLKNLCGSAPKLSCEKLSKVLEK